MHWDVGALGLWGTLGVALIVGGIQIAGWRDRAVIVGLLGIGALCIVTTIVVPFRMNSCSTREFVFDGRLRLALRSMIC